MNRFNLKLREKIKESLTSVMPITVIVMLLCFTIVAVPAGALLSFLKGAVYLNI